MKQVLFYGLWLVVLFLALKLTSIALMYFNFDMDYHFLKSKQELLGNPLWLSFFYVHLLFGVVATLSGPPLFFGRLIRYRSVLHRQLGRLYIFSILLFTAPTGLYLAFSAEGGPWASIGFILMSIAWMLPTYLAFYKIINKDIKGHYRWVIRSYCMTLSGVTLRIFTPIGSEFVGFEEKTNFIISAYVWTINIIVGELVLYSNRSQIKNIDQLLYNESIK